MIRRIRLSLTTVVAVLSVLTSCLDENEYTYYDDAAITTFALGTLNRYYTVTGSQGQDSIIKRTLTCSDYVFNIDHNNGLIWNEDSLPLGVDASKVICTVGAKNGGTVLIQSLTSDTLYYYSSSDSIDFTGPRDFYVRGTSGTTGRHYLVSVNVHQEAGDTCIWRLVSEGNADIAALTDMKGLSDGETIYLFGSDGTTTRLYSTPVSDGNAWTEIFTTPALAAGASKSAVRKGNRFFIYSDGQVLRSDDGAYWDVAATTELRQLAGASSVNLYAISDDGKLIVSADDGVTWEEEELDTDSSYLPAEDISFACRTMETNADTEKLVLIGNRSSDDYPDDTTAVVWSKVEEYSSGARRNAWNYIPFASDNYDNRAPRADNWQIVNYDENNIKAVCGNGKNGSTAVALDRIYHSGDDGITWLNDTLMTVPDGLESSPTAFALVADGVDSVWLICGGTGQVWKGHINRVAWKKEPDYFIE